MFAAVFVTMKPGVFVQSPGHVPAEIVLIKSGILNWEHDVFLTLTGLQRGKALKDSATFILPIELEKQSRASRKLRPSARIVFLSWFLLQNKHENHKRRFRCDHTTSGGSCVCVSFVKSHTSLTSAAARRHLARPRGTTGSPSTCLRCLDYLCVCELDRGVLLD